MLDDRLPFCRWFCLDGFCSYDEFSGSRSRWNQRFIPVRIPLPAEEPQVHGPDFFNVTEPNAYLRSTAPT